MWSGGNSWCRVLNVPHCKSIFPSLPHVEENYQAPWSWKKNNWQGLIKGTLDRQRRHTKPWAESPDLRLRSRQSDFTLRVNLRHFLAFLTISARFSCLTVSNYFSGRLLEAHLSELELWIVIQFWRLPKLFLPKFLVLALPLLPLPIPFDRHNFNSQLLCIHIKSIKGSHYFSSNHVVSFWLSCMMIGSGSVRHL